MATKIVSILCNKNILSNGLEALNGLKNIFQIALYLSI